MSISTKTGDSGQTGLIGGKRVSKGDLRIEAYGTIDELGSVLGFARSICASTKIREATKAIQKDLFTVSGSVTGGSSGLTREMVDALTSQVNEMEAMEGILGDWALPGENTVAAAYDVARTVCRRAERVIVRLLDEGEKVDPLALAYVNRLSDLIWLFGRYVEKEAGVDSRLREGGKEGPSWSRAW
ncbi:MAG TPA: cob(I)yrinic acid a,c-diamide adenosyltransferase [Vicinamibacteria bacterium]|jgi:cob(I)alamin adenosyltransferase